MKTLQNIKLNNKNIIFRADLNVPVVDGKITDYSRIDSIIPSIKQLIKDKNKIFIISHYGRPKGKPNKKFSLNFLCKELIKRLNITKIHFLDTFHKELIKQKQYEMQDGDICLLENIRFNEGEEINDLIFSKNLASNFDFFVNDAFSASHRNHSSIIGLPNFLPSLAGISFINEINNLEYFLDKAKKPNLAIIGGSKISTKINVIYNLINLFDSIVIGGAMANTFLLSNNIAVGKSLLEKDFLEVAKDIQKKAKSKNCKIVLPVDVVCAKNIEDKSGIRMCDVRNVYDEHMILDVGEKTTNLIFKEICKTKSVLWNGPLGAFEYKPFDKSSIKIANSIKKNSIDLKIDTMGGGGDTLSVINLANAHDGFNYLSNAGGAFLEWLEGNKSPGFIALEKNNF